MADGQDSKKEAKQSLFMIADRVGKEVKNGTFEDINKEEHFANIVYYLEMASIYANKIASTVLTAIFSTVLFAIIVFNFTNLVTILLQTCPQCKIW